MTLRVRAGLPTLRQPRTAAAIRECLAAARGRFGLRVVHHSIQTDHFHLIVEADGQEAVGRGMKGLSVRLARRINRLASAAGRVFSDRYHTRLLRSPREVRNALAYVLLNAHKHLARLGVRLVGLDPYSSGEHFDGWVGRAASRAPPPESSPPTSWLLESGWKRHGRLAVDAAAILDA